MANILHLLLFVSILLWQIGWQADKCHCAFPTTKHTDTRAHTHTRMYNKKDARVGEVGTTEKKRRWTFMCRQHSEYVCTYETKKYTASDVSLQS